MTGSRKHRRRVPTSVIIPSRRKMRLVAVGVLAIIAIFVLLDRSVRVPTTGAEVEPSAKRRHSSKVSESDHARYHDRPFRVVRVVDGDTLDIDAPDGDKPATRIRLWGVDTPEVRGRGTRGGHAVHFGPEASVFASDTLLDKTVHVVLAPSRTRGLYGRLLAYVFLERGGRMFNEMLIEQGYAYADYRFDHVYKRQFEDLEKRARKESIGLWKNVTIPDMPEWRQRLERRKGR